MHILCSIIVVQWISVPIGAEWAGRYVHWYRGWHKGRNGASVLDQRPYWITKRLPHAIMWGNLFVKADLIWRKKAGLFCRIAGVFWLHGRVVLSFYRLFDVASHISSFHRLTKEEKPLSQLIVSISPSKSFFPELLILSAKLTYLWGLS